MVTLMRGTMTQVEVITSVLRDERPWGGPAPPAVAYRYSQDRKGERPQKHLAGFRGHLHADGYAGFGELYLTLEKLTRSWRL